MAFATRSDALVEMLLLAEAHALVRYPPASFFSYYASLMKHAPPSGTRPPDPALCEPGAPAPALVW